MSSKRQKYPLMFHYGCKDYGESFTVFAYSWKDADRYLLKWLESEIKNAKDAFDRDYYKKAIHDAIKVKNYEHLLFDEGVVLITERS